VVTANHSAAKVLGECPVCQFLSRLQAPNAFVATISVSIDAVPEERADLPQVVYSSPMYAPANARAPPTAFLTVTAA
jgi:hypothetical protein